MPDSVEVKDDKLVISGKLIISFEKEKDPWSNAGAEYTIECSVRIFRIFVFLICLINNGKAFPRVSPLRAVCLVHYSTQSKCTFEAVPKRPLPHLMRQYSCTVSIWMPVILPIKL